MCGMSGMSARCIMCVGGSDMSAMYRMCVGGSGIIII